MYAEKNGVENGNVIDVKDDGDYDNLNVYDKNGKLIRSVKKDSTSFVQQIINAAGSKQKWDDVNHAMATEYGLSYADGRGWYAVDERGIDRSSNTPARDMETSSGKPSLLDSVKSAVNAGKDNFSNLKDSLTTIVSGIKTGLKSLTDNARDLILGRNDEKEINEQKKNETDKFNELNEKFNKVKNAKYSSNCRCRC